MICFFHRWTKWEQYVATFLVQHVGKSVESREHWQKRRCLKCNFEQRQKCDAKEKEREG